MEYKLRQSIYNYTGYNALSGQHCFPIFVVKQPLYLRSLLCCAMIFFLVSIIGCQLRSSPTSDSDGILSITIDAKKDKVSFPLSEIAEKIDVIALETNELSLIRGEIHSVHFLNDHLIVFDFSHRVLVFDMQGNFVRTIGKRGQGPGELYGPVASIQVDDEKGTVWFGMVDKFVVYDLNGNLVQSKMRDIPTSILEHYYYSNDSIFHIQAKEEKVSDMEYNIEISYIIRAFSNGDYSKIVLDSLFIWKYEPWPIPHGFINTIFQHQGQVYMFFSVCCDGVYDYLYVIKNGQFVPFAKFLVNSTMRGLTVTDRYVAAIHGNIKVSNNAPRPSGILTPEMRAALRDMPPPEKDFSYYVHDNKTGKDIHSYHGFIDDIHHTNDIVPINFIDGGEKFFYTREGEWSEELKCELNPTLYIGTFKK